MSAGFGAPCGACKFLRRKCAQGCVFAPYFCDEQGAAHFAAVHRVFGASNASKLLAHLPASDRSEAAMSIAYEAQARLRDPVYGCVSHIFALQQQVVNLQAQLAALKSQTKCGWTHEMLRIDEDETMLNGLLENPSMTTNPELFRDDGSNINARDDYMSVGGEGDLQSLAYAYLHHRLGGP